MIDQSRWIPAYIVSRLVHFKGTVGNSRKNISPDILQLQRADVDIIKIQKIRFLIVRMSGRISKINLILSIRHILGIRTGTCRLHYLIRPPVYLYLIILIGQRQAGNSRMPANPPPTQIDMLRIIRQDKRRRISGIILRFNHLFISQCRYVSGSAGDTIIETRLIRMARIKDHDPFVRQYQKRRIIMVIRLKIRADQHLILPLLFKVILHSFNIAMYINITDICPVYRTFFIFIMQSPRIGKPAPGSFGSYFMPLCRP